MLSSNTSTKKTGSTTSPDDQQPNMPIEEMNFDQIKDMEGDLKDLFQEVSAEDLEAIRELKAKEEEAETKKEKLDDRINLQDITTEVEKRKGGLPEHIAKLPENHPIRVRWEKGFRQRSDGTWYKQSNQEMLEQQELAEEKKRAFLRIPIILLCLVIVAVGNWYANQLTETRKEIVKTAKFKGLELKETKTREKINTAFRSHSLFEVSGILNKIKKTPRKFAAYDDNQESGSYMQYIKRHNKKFNSDDAMQWRAKLIRKPSWDR